MTGGSSKGEELKTRRHKSHAVSCQVACWGYVGGREHGLATQPTCAGDADLCFICDETESTRRVETSKKRVALAKVARRLSLFEHIIPAPRPSQPTSYAYPPTRNPYIFSPPPPFVNVARYSLAPLPRPLQKHGKPSPRCVHLAFFPRSY